MTDESKLALEKTIHKPLSLILDLRKAISTLAEGCSFWSNHRVLEHNYIRREILQLGQKWRLSMMGHQKKD